MKYSENSLKVALKLVRAISEYLLNEKKIEISDITLLEGYLKQPSNQKLEGKFAITFHSRNRRQDGTIDTYSETVSFDKEGFDIFHFSEEDFYGERYTNREYRFSYRGDDFEDQEADEFDDHYNDFDDDHDNDVEYLMNKLASALKSILRIMNEEKGSVRISTHRFFVKKIKPK